MATILGPILILAFLAFFSTIVLGQNANNGGEIAELPKSPESVEEMRGKVKKFVDDINGKIKEKKGGSWKAEYNERFGIMDEKIKKRLGDGIRDAAQPPKDAESVPENDTVECANGTDAAGARRRRRQATCTNQVAFDARTAWSGCSAIIAKVQDQSSCGSCWAVATASAFTDRYCIERAKKGLVTSSSAANSHFSASDILSCSPSSYGCGGGSPYNAWNWIKSSGVVTGTDYTWKTGCKPYPFPPYGTTSYATPACSASCSNTAWTTGYTVDKKFASLTGWLQGAGQVAAIENQIRNNGTVVASMDVYDDFYYYKTGVYKHVSTNYKGGHAVRLIGWGTRTCSDGTSTPYWMAVNSWNTGWGQAGLFQIAKGTDESRIESRGIYFGSPKV